MSDLYYSVSKDIIYKLVQDIVNSQIQASIQSQKLKEDWVSQFLKQNTDIWTKFVWNQERSWLALSNNIALQ